MYNWEYKSVGKKRIKIEKEDKKKYEEDGNDSNNSVTSDDNHIYFYSSVKKKHCLDLNKEIRKVEQKMLSQAHKWGIEPPPIYLHINSFGGSIFAAMSVIDTIEKCSVDVHSIIEGAAASAATLISVVCNKRTIGKHSHMLIHQLSSCFWGKMNEFDDEMENLNKLMDLIRNIYKEHTNVPKKKLDAILKHDLWWDADKCLEMGLVDEIE